MASHTEDMIDTLEARLASVEADLGMARHVNSWTAVQQFQRLAVALERELAELRRDLAREIADAERHAEPSVAQLAEMAARDLDRLPDPLLEQVIGAVCAVGRGDAVRRALPATLAIIGGTDLDE